MRKLLNGPILILSWVAMIMATHHGETSHFGYNYAVRCGMGLGSFTVWTLILVFVWACSGE